MKTAFNLILTVAILLSVTACASKKSCGKPTDCKAVCTK